MTRRFQNWAGVTGGLLALSALATQAQAAPSETAVHGGSEEALVPPPKTTAAADEGLLVHLEPGSGRLVPRGQGGVYVAAVVGGVTASRAADIVGRPTYASRAPIGAAGMMVSFSSRRPRTASHATISPSAHGLPVASMRMTSGFGMRRHPVFGDRRAHTGVDLAARAGSPIVATSDGWVSKAEWFGGYGLYVALEHGAGLQTRYAHLSRTNVAPGQKVRKGDVIGFVGSTGRSTGPHLHYEMRINGQPVNPLR